VPALGALARVLTDASAVLLGTEPQHAEGTRTKLKCLVVRGILTEPEPGLFTFTYTGHPKAGSS
jgi:hypothetical protein